MTNLYHVLDREPALESFDMYVEIEELARKLVKSGRFRIDAFDKINFARFSLPHQGVNLIFSHRELTDKDILPYTIQTLTHIFKHQYKGENLNYKIKDEINRLLNEIGKHQPVSFDLEMKLARIIVQSAHPVVIMMLLFERVEVFVSYSYNIGDMLDIQGWQQSGTNSGMQSTDGRQVAIFVSAGGDPFAETQSDAIYGDGFPAIARMVVIAGQEIGHYSDIMRDIRGRQFSRHSADFSGTKAKDNVLHARRSDLAKIRILKKRLIELGLEDLAEIERHLKFFKKNKRGGYVVIYAHLKNLITRFMFITRCRIKYRQFINKLKKEKYMASKILAYLADMEFNLDPKADVYARSNKVAQEAISCIEALARVPQQKYKWGDFLTKYTMPGLYEIYYKQVIPACIIAYQNMTKQPYRLKLTKQRKNPWIWLKKLWQKKTKKSFIWQF